MPRPCRPEGPVLRLEHGTGHGTAWTDLHIGQCGALLPSPRLLGPPQFISNVVNCVQQVLSPSCLRSVNPHTGFRKALYPYASRVLKLCMPRMNE